MADEVLLAISTFPDAETGAQHRAGAGDAEARRVREHRRPVQSIYHWQGKIEEAQETMVFFKTTSSRFDEFQGTLTSLHPYEVPEIVARSGRGRAAGLSQWVASSCAPDAQCGLRGDP